MGFEQIDEACIAGQRAEDSDFATPTGTAGVNPLKVAKRNIYVPFLLTESNVLSVATSTPVGVFPGITLPNSGAAYVLAPAMAPRGEISPGEKGILKIAWESAGNSGNIRLVADLAVLIQGISGLSAAVSRNVVQAANASGGAISIAKMEFPPAVLNNNQVWGLKLSRDPANSLDTLASDIVILAVWMEILGRC